MMGWIDNIGRRIYTWFLIRSFLHEDRLREIQEYNEKHRGEPYLGWQRRL